MALAIGRETSNSVVQTGGDSSETLVPKGRDPGQPSLICAEKKVTMTR